MARSTLNGIDALGTPACERNGYRVLYAPIVFESDRLDEEETFIAFGCESCIDRERRDGVQLVLIPDDWTIDVGHPSITGG